MAFWNKMFGKAQNEYLAKDNVGTYCTTSDQVYCYYHSYLTTNKHVPYIFYRFPDKTKQQVIDAFMEIPCIKLSADTNELICLEPLEYGIYETSKEESSAGPYWNAYLRGAHLTLDVYEKALETFTKHGGTETSTNKPEHSSTSNNSDVANNKETVTFLREFTMDPGERMGMKTGIVATKRRYKASSKASALEYLKTQSVTQDFYYIEVETPEGLFGKDKNGVYGE